jgi:hypothetical protein
MPDYNIRDYTYNGLKTRQHNPPRKCEEGSLAYVVSLVDSADHEILHWSTAARVLTLEYETNQQLQSPEQVLDWQRESVPKGFYPQTPVIIAYCWSPLSFMLEKSLVPVALTRDDAPGAIAIGIWTPEILNDASRAAAIYQTAKRTVADARTNEELFATVMVEALSRGLKRGKLVSVIATPGWGYEDNIGSLAKWSDEEIAKADKILWKRTPDG